MVDVLPVGQGEDILGSLDTLSSLPKPLVWLSSRMILMTGRGHPLAGCGSPKTKFACCSMVMTLKEAVAVDVVMAVVVDVVVVRGVAVEGCVDVKVVGAVDVEEEGAWLE